MRRGVAGPYNAAARAWLVAAAASLLLPPDVRLGLWLPLHLALAGAASVAISGNMQSFASALTAGPVPAGWVRGMQFVLINSGGLLIAIGHPARLSGLVSAGGAAFAAAVCVLLALVIRSWRRGLNRRHALTVVLYVGACAAVLAGATIGAMMATGAIADGDTWLALRRAHVTLNLLGWISLTIVGTLLTFLPTVARVRMPQRVPVATGALLLGGLASLAVGLAADVTWVAIVGAAGYAAGALGALARAVRVVAQPRAHRLPIAGRHLAAAVAWFAVGSVAVLVAVANGGEAFDRARPLLLVCFVSGWALQALIGSWLYLLPSHSVATDRRLLLAAVERGGRIGLAAWNVGLLLLVIGLIADSEGAIRAGAFTALGGGVLTLSRAFVYPAIARTARTAAIARRMWSR